MRRAMTDAERKLWWHLRRVPPGSSHWRRQAAIGPFFADFACHAARLVIEIDGGQHAAADNLARDDARTAYLETKGYRVLRFWNNEVLGNIEGVLETIATVVECGSAVPPTPDPSPPRAALAGGGGPKRRAPSRCGF
ncbi:MAG: endonuclease domain-containing protein [Rhodoplanes sp.]|nr:endonuclease domain-containing protein [Rhodoplanes sp.]